MLGDGVPCLQAVGKTTLLRAFRKDTSGIDPVKPSVGLDYSRKQITVNNKSVVFELIDTVSQA